MKVCFRIAIFGLASLFFTGLIFAGPLTPITSPEPTDYTIEDIYSLIHNTPATPDDHVLYPSIPTTAISSYSVSELYLELANLIKRENVATGTIYLGVTGDYGNPDPDYATTSAEGFTATLTPVVSPGEAWGYSLEDICNLINNNSTTTPNSHASTPASTPADSMCTLNYIYETLSTLISPSQVAIGTTYLSVAGIFEPLSCDEICLGLREDLVGYWPFDSDVDDYSGSDNNGINHSATSTQGKLNQGLDFNGSKIPHVEIADSPSLRVSPDLTISAWVYYREPLFLWNGKKVGYIVDKGGRPNDIETDNYALFILNDKLSFEFKPASSTIKAFYDTNALLTKDTWNFVTVVFNDSVDTIYFYVNGDLADTKNTTYSLDPSIQYNLFIGRQTISGYELPFNGIIDEVIIWNRALGDEDISNLYNEGSGRSLMPD